MAGLVTQHVVEALVPSITYSPTTVTGAGVTQHVVEALLLRTGGGALVTQHIIEVLVAANADGTHGDPPDCGDGGTPTTHSYGHAG
jgi:hypothetical protein